MIQTLLNLLAPLLTSGNIAWAIGSLIGLVAGLSWFTAQRKKRVALAVYHAFHIVEDIASETPGTDGFDKAAAALKAADDYMKANGWRPLKPDEQAVAGMQLQSMSGQAKVAAALTTAAPAAPSPQ